MDSQMEAAHMLVEKLITENSELVEKVRHTVMVSKYGREIDTQNILW